MVDDVCKEMNPMIFPGEIQIYFGARKIKDDDVINGSNTYIGSYPKERHRSDLKSPFGLHNVVEDKPSLVKCEP